MKDDLHHLFPCDERVFSILSFGSSLLTLFSVALRTTMLSLLRAPVLSLWTQAEWLRKLGLTETGHSQSVHAVCF